MRTRLRLALALIGLLVAGALYGVLADRGPDFCEQSWQELSPNDQAAIYHDASETAHSAFVRRCRGQGR